MKGQHLLPLNDEEIALVEAHRAAELHSAEAVAQAAACKHDWEFDCAGSHDYFLQLQKMPGLGH